MSPRQNLAIIGSGPSAIYLLKHLSDESRRMKHHLAEISIFEKDRITGMGMPYNPQTTERFNLSNISSEELPDLTISLADWLRQQETPFLDALGLKDVEISESAVYPRLVLGQYLSAQYRTIIARIIEAGIAVREHAGCEIVDVRDDADSGRVILTTRQGACHEFARVVIATGHDWPDEDKPAQGYFASPWPISKLLPKDGDVCNFAIGTLGASLSAFDVASSLAHRHGEFVWKSGRLLFQPHPGTDDFKIVMHATEGLLPHLQFDQVEPIREIYRHVGREDLMELVDASGFLRLGTYFDQVCRPVLSDAFRKDSMPEMVRLLADPHFGLVDFIERMTDEHDYPNAFEGMRSEMAEAEESVLNHKPIHWKEAIDQLMYTLNFHAELMPAEDHLLLHAKFMPFQMKVIAAMPLISGHTLLALYDAGKLELLAGEVSVPEKQEEKGVTTITVECGEEKSVVSYRMFVDCGGQKPLELEEFPFPSLVKSGSVRKARAAFAKPSDADKAVPDEKKDRLFQSDGEPLYHTGGVDVDACYRLIGCDGHPNPRIHDIAFPHTSGRRPYSYGLQACTDTSAIVVGAWVEEING
jgi:uncharacterized NAD(P)/FAD-binding protein YdhS